MKILIIGSGICGLSTYHLLRKNLPETHTIHIYEAYPKSAHGGGGLSLAPNGMRALSAVGPALVEMVLLAPENSYYVAENTMRNAQGSTLARFSMGRKERYGFPNLLLARATVYSALERDLPVGVVTYGMRVCAVREKEGGVDVEFEDGWVETCDLVLGADGVRSTVRPAVVGEGFEAEYRGLTSIGGFIPISSLPPYITDSIPADPMVMTFGPDGFFGYSPISSLTSPTARLMWFSSFSSPTPPPRDLPVETIKAQLLARHGGWVGPEGKNTFRDLIEAATAGEEAAVMVWPTWVTPRLPRYAVPSGRVVLLGDAAHAMPPESGQGASLALEDAQTVAVLLSRFLDAAGKGEGEAEAVRKTAQAFQEIRKARAERIFVEAMKRGNNKKPLAWWEEFVRDWMVWGGGFMPESWQDWKFGYDVEEEVERFLATWEFS